MCYDIIVNKPLTHITCYDKHISLALVCAYYIVEYIAEKFKYLKDCRKVSKIVEYIAENVNILQKKF